MLSSHHLDTRAAGLEVERMLALQRAERRAPLLEALKRSRFAPSVARVPTATARRGRLTAVIRSLHGVLRPAHA
ncbi:MAG TPA: hypothetical protein VGR16_02015 [Thermomicrobiales bacterium]|nr:hypothetical protein [Thermomicrobiales bacterium]